MMTGTYAHNPAQQAAAAQARADRLTAKRDRIAASLARMAEREQAAQVATGEPCRCREDVLDCRCGAYRGVA
jgi:hypothetical protein